MPWSIAGNLRGPAGERGQDGAAGKDADSEAMRALVLDTVRKSVEALPPPRDGRDGRDALDGLIAIEADLENERELAIQFVRANGVRTTLRKALPIPIFRGVHQEGREYARGDNVTKNGCQWSCIADTATVPPSADWVQSTKAGRDGRDR